MTVERRKPLRRTSGLARSRFVSKAAPARRVPLKREAPVEGSPPRPERPATRKRARPAPVPAELRALILARSTIAGVLLCDCCGRPIGAEGYSAHHRDPRGMGGARHGDPHTPANVIVLSGSGTTGCHGRWESQRAEAYRRGLLIRGTVARPETTPILLHGQVWALPTAEGWIPAEPLDQGGVAA